MFKTRLLSGIMLVVLAVAFVLAGGDVLLAATGIISLIGMFELYRVFSVEASFPGVIGYLAAAGFYLNLRFSFCSDLMLLVIGFLIVLMFAFVFSYPKFHASQIMAVFFGLFYVAVMLSYVYDIRMLDHGLYLTFLIYICSWGCDTCAYCAGKLLGRHKMSPKLSPKKSVEGAVGGIAGTALLAALYCYIFRGAMELQAADIGVIAAISAAAAAISMVGDLTASAIKRNYDIKDYGNLIPGHGGILDRFDSTIITAPIIYYLVVLYS